MKKTAILYSITLIVGSALILGINHWITAAQSTPSPTQQTQQTPTATGTPDATTAPATNAETATGKKKSCACCADRMERLKEQIRKARERKQQQNTDENTEQRL